jgi:hypothetical protein
VIIDRLKRKNSMVSKHFDTVTKCVLQNDERSPAVYGTSFIHSVMSVMGLKVHLLCLAVSKITLLYNVRFSLMYHLENEHCP